MTEDANLNVVTSDPTHSEAKTSLFPFDEPCTVTLPNGSKHHFRLWDVVTEKKREDFLKTVIVTSPHLINGESPRDVKTDYTRSALKYYDMMIDKISGVEFNGNGPTDLLDPRTTVNDPRHGEVPLIDLIGASVRKAAASRLYGGKVEVIRPDEIEDEEVEADFDPFAEPDIEKEIIKAAAHKSLYKLTLDRVIQIRQSLGIETHAGRETEPTHVIDYFMREPNGDDFSKWELKAYRGYAISLPKGGERAERYYNLTTVNGLFDSLIETITGATLGGREIDLPQKHDDPTRVAMLAKVPLPIKKVVVATLFSEMSNLGNS